MPCPWHHVLALKLDMDIFTKVLEPLVIVPIPKASCPFVHIDDEDSPMFRQFKENLDCE